MEEKDKTPAEEKTAEKTAWQTKKEGWYDHVPLTVKQLDIIIGVCIAALVVTAVLIGLEAADIFHLFG